MLVIHYSWVGLFYVSAQLIYRHNAAVNVTVILSHRVPKWAFYVQQQIPRTAIIGVHWQNVAKHLGHLRLLVMVTGSDWNVSLVQRRSKVPFKLTQVCDTLLGCNEMMPSRPTRPWARDKVRPSAATEPLPGPLYMRVMMSDEWRSSLLSLLGIVATKNIMRSCSLSSSSSSSLHRSYLREANFWCSTGMQRWAWLGTLRSHETGMLGDVNSGVE